MGTVEAASVQPGTIAWTPKGRRIEVEGPSTARRGHVRIRYYHDELDVWAQADVPGDYRLTLRDPSADAAADAEILILRSAVARIGVALEAGHSRCPFCSAELCGDLIRSLSERAECLKMEKEA